MPKPFPVRTVRVNQIGPFEYDFIRVRGKVDAHLRWERGRWVFDIFEGTRHWDSQELGGLKMNPPMDWAVISLMNWENFE